MNVRMRGGGGIATSEREREKRFPAVGRVRQAGGRANEQQPYLNSSGGAKDIPGIAGDLTKRKAREGDPASPTGSPTVFRTGQRVRTASVPAKKPRGAPEGGRGRGLETRRSTNGAVHRSTNPRTPASGRRTRRWTKMAGETGKRRGGNRA